MKIEIEKLKVETNNKGQVSSIIFDGIELLHQGQEHWKKTFPIIWPVVGISKAFEVDGENYKIPKHGFMKELNWDGYVLGNEIIMMATFIKNEIYPFSIDINVRVWIEEKYVYIETSFSNLSSKEALFHFGYHPAFNIDLTSKINGPKTLAIDLDGKLTNEYVEQEILSKMPFGTKYDTLVNKNVSFNKVKYNYKNLEVEIIFDSPNIQFWKPKDAMFICIEPWWGTNDSEKELITKAEDKEGIIKIFSGETWKSTMAIEIKNTK